MFGNLFTPRYATSSLFPDGMDMHTHILWGVDDGAACLEESLGIIRRLKAMGLKGAYCTPHIMARYPDNTPAAVSTSCLPTPGKNNSSSGSRRNTCWTTSSMSSCADTLP